MVEAEWDGQTLRMRGSNKASHYALAGFTSDPESGMPVRHEGDVVVERADIASVDIKDASRLTNGCLTITTRAGRTFQMHFRRKQAGDFVALAQALRT